jgi:hypothetical protein
MMRDKNQRLTSCASLRWKTRIVFYGLATARQGRESKEFSPVWQDALPRKLNRKMERKIAGAFAAKINSLAGPGFPACLQCS